MSGFDVDWSADFEDWDLECPNTEHHRRYGMGWETEYEATTDAAGDECKPYQGCQCCEDDSGYLAPMMNYVRCMESTNITEKQRIHIAESTGCIVVQKNDGDEWYLAMTSGGMDLSPSIAYVYAYIGERIPMDIVSGLKPNDCRETLGKEKFTILQKELCNQVRYDSERIMDIANDFIREAKAQ